MMADCNTYSKGDLLFLGILAIGEIAGNLCLYLSRGIIG
jgi:hypothetical protein